MAHYRFQDEHGRYWTVWEVHLKVTATVHPDFRNGWIVFESDDEKRRLAPIPTGWEKATEPMLRRWCEQAEAVRKR